MLCCVLIDTLKKHLEILISYESTQSIHFICTVYIPYGDIPMLNVSETEWNLRVDLAAVFHLAVANNLHEAIANHFSALLPDNG